MRVSPRGQRRAHFLSRLVPSCDQIYVAAASGCKSDAAITSASVHVGGVVAQQRSAKTLGLFGAQQFATRAVAKCGSSPAVKTRPGFMCRLAAHHQKIETGRPRHCRSRREASYSIFSYELRPARVPTRKKKPGAHCCGRAKWESSRPSRSTNMAATIITG